MVTSGIFRGNDTFPQIKPLLPTDGKAKRPNVRRTNPPLEVQGEVVFVDVVLPAVMGVETLAKGNCQPFFHLIHMLPV